MSVQTARLRTAGLTYLEHLEDQVLQLEAKLKTAVTMIRRLRERLAEAEQTSAPPAEPLAEPPVWCPRTSEIVWEGRRAALAPVEARVVAALVAQEGRWVTSPTLGASLGSTDQAIRNRLQSIRRRVRGAGIDPALVVESTCNLGTRSLLARKRPPSVASAVRGPARAPYRGGAAQISLPRQPFTLACGLYFDALRLELAGDGRTIPLTPREADILCRYAACAGRWTRHGDIGEPLGMSQHNVSITFTRLLKKLSLAGIDPAAVAEYRARVGAMLLLDHTEEES